MAIGQQSGDLFARLYASAAEFAPTAYFDHEMDQLIYVRTSDSYRADRVDEWLTLLWQADDMKLVGVKIKGFRSLFDKAMAAGLVEEKHFIPLCKTLSLILEASINPQDESPDMHYRKKVYRQAEAIVGDYRVDERKILSLSGDRHSGASSLA
ncbi:hypothetical protein [Nitrospirillum amazonense]|uniref:hypothetical protein n=1 Tax=Nitrospirillum amazonense TaxID=28077 RepID=UPI00119D3E77|nr:hypothetical protein [Nitrospirillum amazonense]